MVFHLNQLAVGWPPVNHLPGDLGARVKVFEDAVELVEAGSGGGARVLRILGESHGAGYAIRPHLLYGGGGEGFSVPEGDVMAVRGTRRGELVEELAQGGPLLVSPVPDGGAPANLVVLLLDALGAAEGDEGGKDGLEGQRDQVPVTEQSL